MAPTGGAYLDEGVIRAESWDRNLVDVDAGLGFELGDVLAGLHEWERNRG